MDVDVMNDRTRQYLPFICCSSEDAVYSVDDGVLNLFPFELVAYVLQMRDRAQLDDVCSLCCPGVSMLVHVSTKNIRIIDFN